MSVINYLTIVLTFKNILFAGLASDGGLYVPERWWDRF